MSSELRPEADCRIAEHGRRAAAADGVRSVGGAIVTLPVSPFALQG